MTLDTQAAIEALVVVLEGIEGVDKVEDRPGGVPTWVERAGPRQSFWHVDLGPSSQEDDTSSATSLVATTFRIEGFMPWSYEDPNTAEPWRDLVDAVLTALRPKRSLDGLALTTRLPQLRTNERVLVPDGEKEVFCHHVVIDLQVVSRPRYTPS